MMRGNVEYTQVDKIMSPQEFEKRVEEGEMLVILDDMVLDVSKFHVLHPGGTFVLTHNNGRDISKFFYGGYSLDGNIGASKPAAGYIHSNAARMVVNSLVIAKYG
jgi:cytochrome b involved in lipid metabolism